MINTPVSEDHKKQLAPFHTLQTMLIAGKIDNASTMNFLPRNLMNLVGVHWLNLAKHMENVVCLSALVEFMIKEGSPFDTDEIKGFDTALKSTEISHSIYETTFARVIVLIGNSKEALLIKAAAAGNTLAVVQLLKIEGIDVNAQNQFGNTALLRAARDGHTSVVTVLLKKDGILINAQDRGHQTALMRAAWNGHISVVTVLLQKNGILINVQDSCGMTALIWAAFFWQTSVAHQLCLHQLLNAPIHAETALFEQLADQISLGNREMVFTTSSLCDYLLESVAALPTTDEKIALLEKALSGTHTFSEVIEHDQRVQIDAVLTKLKSSSSIPPVIFSEAAGAPSSSSNPTANTSFKLIRAE